MLIRNLKRKVFIEDYRLRQRTLRRVKQYKNFSEFTSLLLCDVASEFAYAAYI